MKKTKKLGRPRKKRKYTRRITIREHAKQAGVLIEKDTEQFKAFDPNGGDLGRGTPSTPTRASDSSYVFICGNKVLVRNLTDETLNERFEPFISACEARRQANNLESLEFNLSMEQRYRGLK